MALLPLAILSLLVAAASAGLPPTCPRYETHAGTAHEPFSIGRHRLGYQRPEPACRTFNASEVEAAVQKMRWELMDPDLFRLFENTFPNTLDTTISWKGFAAENPNEELTFIVTGDINAMWLRDSANQLQSYKPLLRHNTSTDSLASLFRGAINVQGRYIRQAPFCNAFQPPPESKITPVYNSWAAGDFVVPRYDTDVVFECKYELDSLAAFFQLSWDYYSATNDITFFRSFSWARTVELILNTTSSLLIGTYSSDGTINPSPFQFERRAGSASETVSNHGAGAPVKSGTGLVRSWFRPSDDSCTYQLFIPANMMYSRYLGACAEIMESIDRSLAKKMNQFSQGIRAGIEKYGRTNHRIFGEMYAYEVDGFGSHSVMDDANIPSLLSAPMLGYLSRDDPTYRNTRKFILSPENPYFMFGPVINATGGPHIGPGMAWPMGLIVQLITSDDDDEIVSGLKQLLNCTARLGLMHESVSSHDAMLWTRQWFSWANGLFGQLMLDLRERKPHLLALSYQ